MKKQTDKQTNKQTGVPGVMHYVNPHLSQHVMKAREIDLHSKKHVTGQTDTKNNRNTMFF